MSQRTVCVGYLGYEWELTGQFKRGEKPVFNDGTGDGCPGEAASFWIEEVYLKGIPKGENLADSISDETMDLLEERAIEMIWEDQDEKHEA